VRVTYTGDAEAAAKQLRDLGFRCSECGVESRFAFSVDQALRFGSGAVEGLREMVLVLRREFGDACVVMLCDACGTVDACIPNGPNSWAPVTPFAGDQ
jgi:RNase P subunit RPR2